MACLQELAAQQNEAGSEIERIIKNYKNQKLRSLGRKNADYLNTRSKAITEIQGYHGDTRPSLLLLVCSFISINANFNKNVQFQLIKGPHNVTNPMPGLEQNRSNDPEGDQSAQTRQRSNYIWTYHTAKGENGTITPANIDAHRKRFDKPRNKPCTQCACGVRFRRKIVGGVPAQKYEFPWMTLLTYRGSFFCGGSVINEQYVATAAHCTQGFNPALMAASFLKFNRQNGEPGEILSKIVVIYRPKAYNTATLDSDMSILKLEITLPFQTNSYLRPICLPVADFSYQGVLATSAGWGTTSQGGSVANSLRKVELPILSNSDCQKTAYGSKITANMMCAGYAKGGKDSCQGDSGGPLMVSQSGKMYLAGVTSWGIGCAQANFPGVYARVAKFTNFINDLTRNNCRCAA